MKLYYFPGACSLSPHIVLREVGLKFDLEQVDLRAKKTKSGADFMQVNPKGLVPALVLDNGEVLTEGPAVVQYICDLKPESGLLAPVGSLQRYRALEWLNFTTSELHKNFVPLFKSIYPEESRKLARVTLANRYDFMEKHLAKNQYLCGSKFSAADPYAFVIVGWSEGSEISLDRWPNLGAYQARIAARPKVQEALKAEGLA
jgi:glutathione S-transferase